MCHAMRFPLERGTPVQMRVAWHGRVELIHSRDLLSRLYRNMTAQQLHNFGVLRAQQKIMAEWQQQEMDHLAYIQGAQRQLWEQLNMDIEVCHFAQRAFIIPDLNVSFSKRMPR